jgi:hypothetical protein
MGMKGFKKWAHCHFGVVKEQWYMTAHNATVKCVRVGRKFQLTGAYIKPENCYEHVVNVHESFQCFATVCTSHVCGL